MELISRAIFLLGVDAIFSVVKHLSAEPEACRHLLKR
jgi:hypothetical protein